MIQPIALTEKQHAFIASFQLFSVSEHRNGDVMVYCYDSPRHLHSYIIDASGLVVYSVKHKMSEADSRKRQDLLDNIGERVDADDPSSPSALQALFDL